MNARSNPTHVLSLGAGVQSTTLALMAELGVITPKPALAVFADTGSEPKAVYEQLAFLVDRLSFPVEIVKNGDLAQDSLKIIEPRGGGNTYLRLGIPAFYEEDGKQIMMQRRCTGRYKITPIRQAVRRFFKTGVVQWIGISTDEASRMRDSDVKYVQNRYPLIEKLMSRTDCEQWLRDHNFQIPQKSSCVFCPFHSDAHWQDLKTNHQTDFMKAVEYERQVQHLSTMVTSKRITPYLHRLKQPLDTIDFENRKQPSLFDNDCSGMCGN